MRAAWIFLFLLLFAGCFSKAPPDFVPAQDVQDAAWEAARSWKSDAVLRGVLGIEPYTAEGVRPEELPDPFRVMVEKTDPAVGDGRAQAWLFHFTSPSQNGSAYEVVVDAHEAVRITREPTPGDALLSDLGEPIQNWLVDSDAASGAMREHNATWRSKVGQSGFNAFVRLRGLDSHPYWWFAVEDADGLEVASGLVSAENATYFAVEQLLAVPNREGGFFDGNLTTIQPDKTHAFTIAAERHPTLEVALVVDTPSAGATVNVTVKDPTGAARSFERAFSAGSTGHQGIAIEKPDQGAWTIDVKLKQGPLQSYRVAWCAEGILGSPGTNDPCQVQ